MYLKTVDKPGSRIFFSPGILTNAIATARPRLRQAVTGFYFLIVVFALNCRADQVSGAVSNAVPGQPAYTEVSRGPHSRVMQSITTWTNAAGNIIAKKNAYTELATGMSHLVDGQWVPSSEQIQLTAGGAEGTNCQHQVHFPASFLDSINLRTPEGQLMTSQISGLVYFDGTTDVVIAIPQDSIGQVLPSLHEVLYTNAFTNALCDVLYCYTKAGFEQNVVIRQQLPAPASFGLTGSNIWLQVWTEFSAASAPQISQPQGEEGDCVLDFGMMKMGKGKAFIFGDESVSAPVFKQWITGARTYLVESIPLNAISAQIQQLPPGPNSSGDSNSVPSSDSSQDGGQSAIRHPSPTIVFVAPPRQTVEPVFLPSRNAAKQSHVPMRMASSTPAQQGLVLDYNLSGSLTNFVFRSDTTYFVSNTVSFYGQTTCERGAVIKFSRSVVTSGRHGLSDSTSASLVFLNANPIWPNSSFGPVIFTGQDDDSVGTQISTSTGAPGTNYYGHLALDLSAISNPTVANVRFSYLFNPLLGTTLTLRNAQAVNCAVLLNGNGYTHFLYNTLLDHVSIVADLGPSGAVGDFLVAQNVTAHHCGTLIADGTSEIHLTNCLFVNVTNWQSLYNYTNYSAFLTNDTGIFQIVGAGAHYLATNSPYSNVGTTNIDSVLLADLRRKTPYPPLWLTNTITNDTILNPQVQPDTNSHPSYGYHYDPIDFISFCPVTNAMLTLTNGVVLAYYNGAGIWLQNSSRLVSEGTPNQHNYLVAFQLVQEQSINLWSGQTTLYALEHSMAINTANAGNMRNPSIYLRFNTLCSVQGAASFLSFADNGWDKSSLVARDCEFYGAGADWSEYSTTNYAPEVLQNNLFHRVGVDLITSGQITTGNNLFIGTSVGNADVAINFNGSGSSSNTNLNNAFDSCNVYLDGVYSNSAYLNSSTNNNTAQPNDIVTNLTWVAGALGNYYQATNSPLINMGSTSATNLGLFHYTTTTNQVPETNSVVDIGYHYVALGANGLPEDTNGDGIPDYLQDSNGNGLFDIGEVPWGVTVDNPVNGSVIY